MAKNIQQSPTLRMAARSYRYFNFENNYVEANVCIQLFIACIYIFLHMLDI